MKLEKGGISEQRGLLHVVARSQVGAAFHDQAMVTGGDEQQLGMRAHGDQRETVRGAEPGGVLVDV